MQPRIRLFTDDDIGFALQQTAREGWDDTPELLRALLTHDPAGCFVAELDGRRAGIITTTRHGQTAWIGNLIVLPEERRKGIGERLMTHVLELLTRGGARTIRLDADPLGVKLYRRLGFVDEFESLRFRHSGLKLDPAKGAERLSTDAITELAAFDAPLFGDDRVRLLELFLRHGHAACCVRRNERMSAFAIVFPSTAGVRLGPWVALDDDAALTVMHSALQLAPQRPIIVGVPDRNTAAVTMLTSMGFERTLPCLRMVYGPSIGVGHQDRIYAMGQGATG